MRTLAAWDPFRELEDFSSRLSGVFGRPLARKEGHEGLFALAEWAPSVDIVENKKEYAITAELPEIKKDNVKVMVENGVLTISGERKYEHEEKDAKALRVERSYGSFARSFAVPDNADGSKISAEFKEGILKVRMPKSEDAKPKQVEVKCRGVS